jgi:hypothetical protein
LVIVDVDEVLAMFMHGFERFVGKHGYEMRIERFALFQVIFKPGETEHLDVSAGRALFDEFFRTGVEDIEPAEGAAAALEALRPHADIVILTNAPPGSREGRTRWLQRHGFPYPMVVNAGLKGPAAAALAARCNGTVVFVDDLLPNLESVHRDVPGVRTFQMVADHRLRPFAPCLPERHPRHDDWRQMREAIEAVVRGSAAR